MELTKISVIALSFGLLCNAAMPPILQYHDSRRSAETTPVSSDCICLPKVENAQLLTDMIGGEGIDLERLVIYFYINPQTKKITAYTPNVAKQQIFSDLSFEVGDELQPIQSYENINNIVILNPNKIERTRGRHEYLNYLTIDENQNPREFITSAPTDSVNIAKDENIPVIGPHEENIIETNEVLNILPSDNNTGIHFHPNANMEVKDNLNLETLDKENIINQLLPAQESGVISIQNINQAPEHIAHAWQTHSINDYNGIWNNTILKDVDHHVENAQDIQRPGYLNFDRWFEQQMGSSIIKQMQNNVNFPDEVLKNHVYNKLFQNGIISMGNGKLKTHQGDILNLSNLKLQPILAGHSLGYNYPSPGSHGKIVHPYFDAMALYMNNPLKVLGIIPISSVYNPKSMGYIRTNLNKYPSIVTSTVVKTHCLNDKCYTNTMAKKSPWRASRLEKKETILTEYNMNDRSAQGSGNNANLNYNNRLHFNKQLESKRVPVINDVSMKLYNMLVGDKVDKIAGKKTPKYEVRTTEDEGPDTRILGGSAATGSGTPISIRGRSAFD